MKNSCSMASLILFLAFFANAQEASLPLSNDSSLTTAQEINETKVEKKMPEKCDCINPESYQKNLRTAFYLHPLPLFIGAASNMFMFNSTVEIPLNLSNSVVVMPSAWLGNSDGYVEVFDAVKYEKLIRIGSGIGMRRYARDRGQGFYLQAIASAYYISAKSLSHKENSPEEEEKGDSSYIWEPKITTYKNIKGVVCDLIFYIGATHKWQNIGFFYEGGLGFGYDGTHTYQLGYINKLAASFNLGVGIPL